MQSKEMLKTPISKIPPQSIEAEESILSTILIGGSISLDALNDILEILSPKDFYKISHRIIFSTISDLFSKGEPSDIVTVTSDLRDKNCLEKIGGASYLARLIEVTPVAVNVQHYAKIIKDKSILRTLIDKSSKICNICFENDGNVESVINFAEKSIFEVSESRNTKSINTIGEIVQINIHTLEERQGNKSLITGIPTGFSQIDKLTSGLQNSDLIILAARPAMGKTALALNIARNAAVIGKKSVAIFSLEMSKEQLSMRMLCAEARVDASKIRNGFLTQDDWFKITDAAGKLADMPIYIDDSPSISTTSIRTKSRRFKMDKNLGLIIIDYLQLMKGNSNFDQRRDLEISEISRSLKMLAKELNIPIIALSQLNRKLEERSDKRPQLSDLRESGALEQDADIVAFIYRDEIYNKDPNNPNKGIAEIIISKQRNGPTGFASLTFISSYTRFENLAIGS